MAFDNRISHRCLATMDDRGRGWRGQFTAPGHGSKFVRNEDGTVRFFPTEERAFEAATRAMCAALDAACEGQENSRPRTVKVIFPKRPPSQRFARPRGRY